MIDRRGLLAAVLAAALGCASEGGVVGTGVTSSISGNVAAVESNGAAGVTAAAAHGALPFPIRVTIDEAPGLKDTTGAEGGFLLEGDFAGALTLRFSGPEGSLAALALDLPAGADLVLADIVVRPHHGGAMPRETRQRNFFGRVRAIDCERGALEIFDDLSRVFGVRLLPITTILFGPTGREIGCVDMRVGDPVLVEGLVDPRPPIEALVITVRPPPRGPR